MGLNTDIEEMDSAPPRVNQRATRSICVILNERAVVNETLTGALQDLQAKGIRVETRPITYAGEGIALAQSAADDGFDVIAAAGGDGTLNEVLNGSLRSGRADQIALAVIPTGTANDFATQCNITLDRLDDLLSLLAFGPAVPVDVGRANGRYFINLASGGYGAEITSETPPEIKHLLGGFSYFVTGLTNMNNLSAKQAHIVTPELEWEGALLALSVGNGRQAGGGFKACPRAFLNDGLFDVLVIPDIQAEDLILLLRDLIRLGRHVEHQYVQYFQTPWLRIESQEGIQVNLDGEPLKETEFHFEILPSRIPFLLPPNPLLLNCQPQVLKEA